MYGEASSNYKLINSQFSEPFLPIIHGIRFYISEAILFRGAAREQRGFIVVTLHSINTGNIA
jgi:hypothetical protein